MTTHRIEVREERRRHVLALRGRCPRRAGSPDGRQHGGQRRRALLGQLRASLHNAVAVGYRPSCLHCVHVGPANGMLLHRIRNIAWAVCGAVAFGLPCVKSSYCAQQSKSMAMQP